MTTTETHPWKWFVPQNSTTLIVGTFPPTKRNWAFDFFYPNKLNLFWPVISKIANKQLVHFSGDEAVQERKQLLELLHTGITDMGSAIIRTDNSSLDENIAATEYMDIFQILVENQTIRKVIFTSSSGPVSAATWFTKYLKQQSIIHKFPKGPKPLRCEFMFQNRAIELVILYSPSRRAANRISFDKLVEMYEREIKI